MADGRGEEASALLSRTTALANVRGGAQGAWWGPSATKGVFSVDVACLGMSWLLLSNQALTHVDTENVQGGV